MPDMRNFVCPLTEAACVDPRCKQGQCAKVGDEAAQFDKSEAVRAERMERHFGPLWDLKL
jgi:hypothetical protein